MILILSGYSKSKDILQTLDSYKIPAKEHQVVDRLAADEISISEMFLEYLKSVPLVLENYKKTKGDKNFHIYNFLFVKCQIGLRDNS